MDTAKMVNYQICIALNDAGSDRLSHQSPTCTVRNVTSTSRQCLYSKKFSFYQQACNVKSCSLDRLSQ